MYILFIVTSFWAYGEVTIACEFAGRAREAGYIPYFLIPPSHEKVLKKYQFQYTTLMPRNGKINKLLMKDIEARYKPGLVILADFLNYNFCEGHYGLTPEDLAIFSGRLGTFDDFDWVITGKQMDTYGFKAEKFGEIDIRKYGFGLCPCPVVNPLDGNRNNTYHYQLSTDLLPYERGKTGFWKERLGLPLDKKMIIFTHATWQETYKQYPDVVNFVEVCNEIFMQVIEQLTEQHLVVCIGPKGFFSHPTSDHYLHKEQLPPDVFEQFLLAADLFISRNIVATTLARVVLSGIPAANFSSSMYFSKDKPFDPAKIPFQPTEFVQERIERLERAYPYRMFPVGWFKFLAPVVKGNPYLNTLINLEQFDAAGALEKINKVLESNAEQEALQNNLHQYSQVLQSLPSIESILGELTDGRGR